MYACTIGVPPWGRRAGGCDMLAPPPGGPQRGRAGAGCAIIVLVFRDRREAGRSLGEALAGAGVEGSLVLGIPRGGVIVAAEVARALGSPLDVVVTRKLGAPGNPELAIGAIAPGVRVVDEDLLRRLGIDPAYVHASIRAEEAEIARRTAAYRGDRPPPPIAGHEVVIVDDGL